MVIVDFSINLPSGYSFDLWNNVELIAKRQSFLGESCVVEDPICSLD